MKRECGVTDETENTICGKPGVAKVISSGALHEDGTWSHEWIWLCAEHYDVFGPFVEKHTKEPEGQIEEFYEEEESQ